jgi:hypothetical protein
LKFDYRYPALATVPFGNRGRTRHFVVSMHGSVDIPELSSSEVPVAAMIAFGTDKTLYRYHEGSFYLPCHASASVPPHEGDVGLDMHMLLAMNDVSNREGRPLSLNPRELTHRIVVSSIDRDSTSKRVPGRFTRMRNEDWHKVQEGESLADYDEEQKGWWSNTARSYADSLLVIDGKVWVAVPEPLICLQFHEGNLGFFDADTGVYSSVAQPPRDVPMPYGRKPWYRCTSPYWNGRSGFESLLDADHLQRLSATPPVVEVYLPSAFSEEHALREIDRIARVIACELHHIVRLPDKADKLPHEVTEIYRSLTKLTKGREGMGEGDLLEEPLRTLQGMLSWTEYEPPALRSQILGKHWEKDFVSVLEHTLDRWRNRSISLDLSPAATTFFPSCR